MSIENKQYILNKLSKISIHRIKKSIRIKNINII